MYIYIYIYIYVYIYIVLLVCVCFVYMLCILFITYALVCCPFMLHLTGAGEDYRHVPEPRQEGGEAAAGPQDGPGGTIQQANILVVTLLLII